MPHTSPFPAPAVAACAVAGTDHPVERARADDLDGIADTLAAAFADYAWTNWIVPADGRRERLRSLQALTTGRVGLPYGEVWVTRCPGAGGWVVGAVVGIRPDREVPGSVWADLAPAEEVLLGSRAEAAGEAEAATAHLRPRGPLVTIATIGVHPSHWRRGLATRLLRPVLDVARELEAPAYLETSSTGNVSLYQRSGFRVIGETVVPRGGPRVWAMQT